MIAEILLLQFQHTHALIRMNCMGLTQAESLFQPLAEGNCLNWVLGHILVYRDDILELLGAKAIWTDTEAAPYRRGAPPITAEGQHVQRLERMIGDLNESQIRLAEVLRNLTAVDLDELVEGESRARLLAGYQAHEAYHAGQLAMLRRIAGKPRALEPDA
jgi:hypothetical protein